MLKIKKFLDNALAVALVIAMSSILLTVIWQVISRYLLKDPASVTEELSRFILIWIGILGAAYAYSQKAHLGFNLIVEKMSQTRKRIVLTIVELCVIAFCAVTLSYGGMKLVNLTFELEQISAALEVKMGFIYFVLPLSGCLIIFYAIMNIIDVWTNNTQQEIQ
ncbi:TRAP transporter small permease [Glaciecola sp. 1036]|uniref:TRAP transporter small permease n=1 Tax=Alteromonadaceae TaxID=72275 RepID=UPI003D0652B6